jgi:hypothetical protein
MARKARKKSTTKRKKKAARKARPKSAAGKVAGAYRVVVDTVRETDRLRNKLEPPATSETE